MDKALLQWLARSPVIRTACDLDLLLFFARHSRALLTTEQVAAFVGYGLKQVSECLEHLVAAGLVRRQRAGTPGTCLFAFEADETDDGSLAALLRFAADREGRLAVMSALDDRSATEATSPLSREASPAPAA